MIFKSKSEIDKFDRLQNIKRRRKFNGLDKIFFIENGKNKKLTDWIKWK